MTPFMEQTARYEAVRWVASQGANSANPNDGVGPGGERGETNPQGNNALYSVGSEAARTLHAATGGVIPSLLCPSDSNSTQPGRNFGARTNIMVSYGDAMNNNAFASAEAGTHSRCGRRGVFAVRTWNDFGTIADGTSNTIAAAEGLTGDLRAGASPNVKGGIQWFSTYGTPLECATTSRSAGDPNTLVNPLVEFRGHWHTHGQVRVTGFSTVLRPNDVNCAPQNAIGSWGMMAAQSNHTGGVNVLFMDGSVSFVSETIDNGNLMMPGTTNHVPHNNMPGNLDDFGASPFGVWGAIGTKSGGESVRL